MWLNKCLPETARDYNAYLMYLSISVGGGCPRPYHHSRFSTANIEYQLVIPSGAARLTVHVQNDLPFLPRTLLEVHQGGTRKIADIAGALHRRCMKSEPSTPEDCRRHSLPLIYQQLHSLCKDNNPPLLVVMASLPFFPPNTYSI